MQADGTFTVTLEIIHNPGFTAIEISHDASRMGVTVLSVDNTGIAAKATLDDGTNINQLIRIVNFTGDIDNDGPILQLTVKPNTAGDKTLTFNCVNCGNWDSQQINVRSASVDLVEVTRVKGDIDGNNDCDIFDVIRLLRYLNDKSTTVVIENCNVDGAGTIDIFDVIRLLRYLNDKSTVIY
jgi:hypothetical protein